MNESLVALLIGSGVVIAFIFFFYPRKGFLARLRKVRQDTNRVNIEDALKHLYDCEYNNNSSNLDSISGSLSISKDDAAKVIQHLTSMGLIEGSVDNIRLNSEGRSYALRVIRIHRLWERYLADETSVHETEWHERAEEVEHRMSLDEANELAAQIGNPLVDPHGDPIPDANGSIREKQEVSITYLKEGDIARITHLEDEPKTIYAQLVAEGLYVGQQVRINKVSQERITFEANGELIILAPIFAANISVERLPDTKLVVESSKKLSDLKIGESGKVIAISKAIRGQQRRRLLDLGIVPGTRIKAEIESLGGDPTGYRVKGATIAIRKNQASQVFIKNIETGK